MERFRVGDLCVRKCFFDAAKRQNRLGDAMVFVETVSGVTISDGNPENDTVESCFGADSCRAGDLLHVVSERRDEGKAMIVSFAVTDDLAEIEADRDRRANSEREFRESMAGYWRKRDEAIIEAVLGKFES